jgi:thiamine-phosphate pyrophosphorylase
MLSDLDRNTALRILDANYNRATEGLRTIEEIARFGANSSYWQVELKKLRHAMADAFKKLPAYDLLQARCAQVDVGAENTIASEQQRLSLDDIQRAAVERVQQALRCLEEFSKPLDGEVAVVFSKIRFSAYDIFSRLLTMHLGGKVTWGEAKLYVLVDLRREESVFLEHIHKLADVGVDVIQIRDKQADAGLLIDRCRKATEALANRPTRLIVNDRLDIALVSQANGIHVGQEDISVTDIRKLCGLRLSIGLSTHNLSQLKQAEELQPDYIGCGPTFASTTKSFDRFAGLEFLLEASHTCLPAFAIGGITLERLSSVLATGIQRVAVAGDIDQAADPYQQAKRYVDILKG